MKTQHSSISPSNFERRLLCPGSLTAEKDLPETISKYAEEGKMLHERVVQCMNFDNWSRGLTDAQKEAVSDAVIYFTNLKLDKEIIKEIHEKTFDLSFIYAEMKGTTDSVIITADDNGHYDLHVIDYKFGKGVAVNAYQNYQLLLYYLGVISDSKIFSILENKKYNVHLHIVQPFLNNSVWSLDKNDESIFTNLQMYRDIALKCYEPDALRIVNEKACKFCKAKPTCPELARFVPNTKLKLYKISDEEIANMYDNRNLITMYIKSVEEYIKDKLDQGSFLDYALKPKLSNRKWNDGAYAYLSENLGDDAFEINKKLIGITKAEKLLGKDIVNKLSIREEGENEIVKITDEAIKMFEKFKKV